MQSSRELDLHDEEVKITWCTCERCSAAGPRFMTLIRNRREITVDLDSHCCAHDSEDDLVCGERYTTNGSSCFKTPSTR